MEKRFVSLWFPHLITDWVLLQKPVLKETPFVLASPRHGRMIVSATSAPAAAVGIETGMVVADAR
ncbi:MAG: DNA polymerase Y family protein, partial [Siphonobacter aquaeclarae]|nr:DNA polymerase Y family protein [Siphonobacter aquaeclarae]